MAARPHPPTTPPTPPPAPEPPATAAPDTTDPVAGVWFSLTEPIAMESKASTAGISANVVETVPEPIRQRAEASLTVNTARVAAKANSTATRPRVDYHWLVQQFALRETAERFVKLITKYAKYRPMSDTIPHAGEGVAPGQATCRTGEITHYRLTESNELVVCSATAEGAFIGVRYSVRPLEQRHDANRLPGTA